MSEDRIGSLRVRRTELASATANGANDQGEFELSRKHVMKFGRFVDDVIHG